jgi:hypothetical protein
LKGPRLLVRALLNDVFGPGTRPVDNDPPTRRTIRTKTSGNEAPSDELIPLTVNEIRRLFARLTRRTTPTNTTDAGHYADGATKPAPDDATTDAEPKIPGCCCSP